MKLKPYMFTEDRTLNQGNFLLYENRPEGRR